MKFQFPEDFVPSEEQLELQFSVNEWKIIQKALIQFALQDLSITPARMAKQIKDELANTQLQQNMEKLAKMVDPDMRKTLEECKLPPDGSVSVPALIQRFKKAK